MKKFTKILALIMALVFVVTAFSACGGTTNDDPKADENAKLAILDTEYITEDYAIAVSKDDAQLLTDINNALVALKADGTVKKIQDKYISGIEHDLVFQQDAEGKEEITMGTNAEFPPYEFKEGDGIVGIDAEIAAAIAEKLGYELNIEDMAFDSIIAAVSSGKADFGLAG
ncbi:MAG: transporter substrate-binding domain-containing protein, partial [Clostridia bacterium]|nr:transporter substrate-binding domain-containing protein [Clostridia bacterium]